MKKRKIIIAAAVLLFVGWPTITRAAWWQDYGKEVKQKSDEKKAQPAPAATPNARMIGVITPSALTDKAVCTLHDSGSPRWNEVVAFEIPNKDPKVKRRILMNLENKNVELICATSVSSCADKAGVYAATVDYAPYEKEKLSTNVRGTITIKKGKKTESIAIEGACQ